MMSFFRTLNSWLTRNLTLIEHVRVFIDQNQESDSNNTANQTNSFIIVKENFSIN